MIAKSPAMPMRFHATLFEDQKHIPKRQRRENNPVPRRTFEDGLFSEEPRRDCPKVAQWPLERGLCSATLPRTGPLCPISAVRKVFA